MGDQSTNADPVAVNDRNRTARAFISFLNTVVNDQSYPGQDGYAVNPPRQYQTIGPGGLVGVEGTSSSNGQSSIALSVSPLMLLMLAAGAWFLLKK